MRDPTAWYGKIVDRGQYLLTYSLPEAPINTAQAPCPVVLVSPSLTGGRNDLGELNANLASHGYVVMSVDHWDAESTVYPDGSYVKSHAAPDGNSLTVAGFQDRVKDLLFMLEELARWNSSDPAFGS